jgi:diguanylate cyclase (GGDEF)-like protein
MIFLGVLGLYAIVFSLFGNSKKINLIEWIVVLIGVYLLKDILPMLSNILLLVPFIKIISNEVKWYENLFVVSAVSIMIWLMGTQIVTIAVIGSSLSLILILLSNNFKMIGIVEIEIEKIRKENQELRYNSSQKNNQIDIISKLFYRKKRLENINTIRKIIEEMVETSNELYNSDYATLYQFKDGLYERVLTKGDYDDKDIIKEKGFDKNKKVVMKKDEMSIPIDYEKRPWGLLVIKGKKTELMENKRKIEIDFENSDLEIILLYIETAMARLKEVKLTDTLTEAAFYDRLTSVPNRAYLEKDLLKEKIKEIQETRKPFGVLIVDIDNFKSFNDTFGHNVGDEVLKTVARISKDSLKDPKDKFGRWGGEEFVAFITGDMQDIIEKAEVLRGNIENYNFPERKITISGGIALFGVDGKILKDVIEKADIALYESKKMGKNQIRVYKKIRDE